MTLGLGGKEKKPSVVKIEDGEVLIPKDSRSSLTYSHYFADDIISISDSGTFVGPDGKPTRLLGIDWHAVPEENG